MDPGRNGGVHIVGTRLDMTGGAPIRTDRELDVYIQGKGFLRVELGVRGIAIHGTGS